MTFPRTKVCMAIRAGGVISCLAFSAWAGYSILRPVVVELRAGSESLPAVLGIGLALLMLLLISASTLWLAWRLWFRWNTATVRWLIGICTAVLLLWLDMLPARFTQSGSFQLENMISSLLAIPLLIGGAIGFRYLSHRLIRFAELPDSSDLYGQPIWHQSRIRNFAGLLGFAIFLAGNSVDELFDFSRHPDSWQAQATMLGPAIVGYLTYKIIVWYSKPRTQPAQPSGGFEVITHTPPLAQPTELI